MRDFWVGVSGIKAVGLVVMETEEGEEAAVMGDGYAMVMTVGVG